jgi:hypothetical protein
MSQGGDPSLELRSLPASGYRSLALALMPRRATKAMVFAADKGPGDQINLHDEKERE